MADLDLGSEEHTAQYGAAVDEYLTGSYDGDRRRKLLERDGWDAAFAGELAELGWYSLAVPEHHGGLGLPLAQLGPVFMQLGRHLVVGPLLENLLLPAILTRADELVSTPAASAAVLSAVSSAVETGVPLALVDPGVTDDWAGDLGSVTLTAQRLSGTVTAVRFARQASRLVVIAETGAGAAVCLMDPAAPGVHIDEVVGADPAIEFARVVLDDVLAEGAVWAGPAGGELVARLRSWARLLIACELSGIARRSVELTVTHLGQREQFGRAIGSFQAVAHLAADMHTRATGLHNLCLAALADADRASVAELDLLAVTAKAHAAETAVRVCEDAIQLHGGMGFTTESDVSWYYRRALALRGWYGDETELQLRIGQRLLDRDHDAVSDPEGQS